MSLNREEQIKINNQLKERLEKHEESDEEIVEEDEAYYDEDKDNKKVKAVKIDFKTLRNLFYKEQQLNRFEERVRFQTLDISNLTIQKEELEEKVKELEEELEVKNELIEFIEKIVKFNNKEVGNYKLKDSNEIIELQKNITEIEIIFRKTDKEYNEIIKNISGIQSEELKKYFNTITSKKYRDIVTEYDKRHERINRITSEKYMVNTVSVIIMLISLIYSAIVMNTK